MMCCVCVFVSSYFVFFSKQKTAYEMRISDWSSDVCSSDLARDDRLLARADHDRGRAIARFGADDAVEFGFGGHRDRGVDEAGVDLLTALDARVEIAQHIARQGDVFGRTFEADAIPARGDVDAEPAFERHQMLVILAEEDAEQLRLVERHLEAGTIARLGGDRKGT